MEKTARTPCLEEMPITRGRHYRLWGFHQSPQNSNLKWSTLGRIKRTQPARLDHLPAKDVRIWVSSFLILGVLPVPLLWIITGFSLWTLSSLFWLLIALGYVLVVIGRFHGSEKQEALLHAGLRVGYFSLMLVLFFGLAIPLLGTVAMFFPLGPDSVNQWFIAKKTRRLIVLRVLVYVLVISILLWINSRL